MEVSCKDEVSTGGHARGKYSAFKIRCQMELGERTAKMESASGARKDLVSHRNEVTKTEKVKKLGLTRKQAWQNEQLIKPENRAIVEKYLLTLIRIRENKATYSLRWRKRQPAGVWQKY